MLMPLGVTATVPSSVMPYTAGLFCSVHRQCRQSDEGAQPIPDGGSDRQGGGQGGAVGGACAAMCAAGESEGGTEHGTRACCPVMPASGVRILSAPSRRRPAGNAGACHALECPSAFGFGGFSTRGVQKRHKAGFGGKGMSKTFCPPLDPRFSYRVFGRFSA
jgi:hypothetical protein